MKSRDTISTSTLSESQGPYMLYIFLEVYVCYLSTLINHLCVTNDTQNSKTNICVNVTHGKSGLTTDTWKTIMNKVEKSYAKKSY